MKHVHGVQVSEKKKEGRKHFFHAMRLFVREMSAKANNQQGNENADVETT